ncbi:MerR family transcriptional regulator [Cellulomonas sp. WB94]|nr:MerR family transcriptional regulator [Cellulomonas sp. WB94]
MLDEAWSIGDVARLSGVTSRTLRHYDSIGLLTPVGTAPGGRRLYGRDELVRLQQILVLRELGVDLPSIGRVVRSGDDRRAQLAVLRQHHERLLAERDRYDRLAATVASTLQSLDGGRTMAAKDLYAGFDNSEYEVEARERWGTEAVDRGASAWERLGKSGQAEHQAEATAIGEGLAACLADGLGVDDPRVQSLVARHHAQVALFWVPNRESYTGLGQMYVDDPRFTATYDAFAPGLAPYLRDAMAVFAAAQLT